MRLENIRVPLDSSQADRLIAVLTSLHHDKPHFQYIVPNAQARARLLPGLFREAVRVAELYGEIQATQNLDSCTLWVGPGSRWAIVPTLRSRLSSIAPQLGLKEFRRGLRVGMHLDAVHHRLVRGHHWSLLAQAFEPTRQKEEVGATLLEPVLARANAEGLPCYLETFNEEDLHFYVRYGFRIAGCGKIGSAGPAFWALIRGVAKFS